MRTVAVEAARHVAIVAKNLKSLGVVVLTEPCVNRAGTVFHAHFTAMSRTVAVCVVNAQKLILRFTTTGAASTVGGQYLLPAFQPRAARGGLIGIRTLSRLYPFGMSFSIAARALNSFKAVLLRVGCLPSLVTFSSLLCKEFGISCLVPLVAFLLLCSDSIFVSLPPGAMVLGILVQSTITPMSSTGYCTTSQKKG